MKELKQQSGFTLIEVMAAVFVLSVAVVSTLLVAGRSLIVNQRANRVHEAIMLGQDVFAAVQESLYQNALNDQPIFEDPFTPCLGGKVCQLALEPGALPVYRECAGGVCSTVKRGASGFYTQEASGQEIGYERSITMEKVGEAEFRVSVNVAWNDRGQDFERDFTRHFFDWYNMDAYYEYGRVIASVVTCSDESYLPNWGDNDVANDVLPEPALIGKSTAQDYVNALPQCSLDPGWLFQWGYLTWGPDVFGYNYGIDESLWVDNTDPNLIGEADGSYGPGTYTYDTSLSRDPFTNEWKTFGTTDIEGRTAVIIPNPEAENFALRLVMQSGYVPFSYYFDDDNYMNQPAGGTYSAEMYCDDDIHNFDNYDYIPIDPGGNVYYCVAFVSP